MDHKNVFTKGITTDLDYMLRSPDSWDFPTLNIRVINKEGQGLVVTGMKGNEKHFQVSDGFMVIGASEYNGIIYIVSCNDDTGHGEIGSYPSPEQWLATNTSFVREYKAFHNFGNDVKVGSLRSTLFNMSTQHYADVFVRISYDNTANVYITDFHNPIRVVNSNFKQTGESVGRYYTEESFDGALNLIASTKKIPYCDSLSVINGGEMPPGNYFLFYRYLTADYNSTHFVSEYGVISVFDGTEAPDITGAQYKDWLNNVVNKTNKKISFTVRNLDQSYAYFQIGVLHYTATTENAAAIRDVYLINKSFPITGESKNITILGTEAQSVLAYAELITPRIPYNINKSHTEANNTYYGGNWKKTSYGYDKEKLAQYAQELTYYFVDSGPYIGGDSFWGHQQGYSQVSAFKNPKNTIDFVGLAKGEIYPYAIIYQFADGTESEAYPVLGRVNGLANDVGLVQIRDWLLSDTINRSIGVRFDVTSANGYYNLNEKDFEGVTGFRIVRGERIKNLICQGMLLPCYQGLQADSPGGIVYPATGFGMNKTYNADQNLNIPLYKGYLPCAVTPDGTNYKYYASRTESLSKISDFKTIKTPKKYGLFCPDVTMGKIKSIPTNTYLKLAFNPRINEYVLGNLQIQPATIGVEVNCGEGLDPKRLSTNPIHFDKEIWDVDTVFVEKGTEQGPSRFTSSLPGRSTYAASPGASYYYNRSLATGSYIGITTAIDFDNVEKQTLILPSTGFVVNLYANNPDDTYFLDVVSSFDPTVEIYQPVSNFIPITNDTSINIFKGDCFPTKLYIRSHRFNGYDYAASNTNPISGMGGDGWEFVAGNGIWYQYGMGLGLFTENFLNVDMRNEVKAYDPSDDEITYTYFPKCLDFYENLQSWIVLRDIPAALVEATQVNDGYNNVLPSKYFLGYDSNLPEVDDNQRPGRIYHSSKNIPGSIIDSFRSIALSNKIDVNSEYGAIIKLLEFSDDVISIQEYAINQHPIKERVTQSDTTSGEILLADSVELLPTYFKKLAEFGSQHMSGIIKTPKGIYGVDWLNSVVWIIAAKSTQTGRRMLSANDLLENKLLAKWFNDYKTQITSFNDIKSKLTDDPVNGTGIVLGYNKKYDEVYFTFLFDSLKDTPSTDSDGIPNPPQLAGYNNTLIYNELINAFVGEASFTPYAYLGIRDDLYTLEQNNPSEVFKHDSNNFLKFYDTKYPLKLSFIVNGRQGDKSLYDFEKIFQALKIEMSKEDLYSIAYETESQFGSYVFLTSDNDTASFWKHSEYTENEWRIPVVVETRSKDKDYDCGSDMRGHWMKVTIVYNPTTDAQAIYIKKVISNFIISKS